VKHLCERWPGDLVIAVGDDKVAGHLALPAACRAPSDWAVAERRSALLGTDDAAAAAGDPPLSRAELVTIRAGRRTLYNDAPLDKASLDKASLDKASASAKASSASLLSSRAQSSSSQLEGGKKSLTMLPLSNPMWSATLKARIEDNRAKNAKNAQNLAAGNGTARLLSPPSHPSHLLSPAPDGAVGEASEASAEGVDADDGNGGPGRRRRLLGGAMRQFSKDKKKEKGKKDNGKKVLRAGVVASATISGKAKVASGSHGAVEGILAVALAQQAAPPAAEGGTGAEGTGVEGNGVEGTGVEGTGVDTEARGGVRPRTVTLVGFKVGDMAAPLPINELRNHALCRVATTHALYSDVDLWPSATL
jgi:hypothetical protein